MFDNIYTFDFEERYNVIIADYYFFVKAFVGCKR